MGLVRHASPIVAIESNHQEPCPTGRAMMNRQRILGRTRELVKTPARRIMASRLQQYVVAAAVMPPVERIVLLQVIA